MNPNQHYMVKPFQKEPYNTLLLFEIEFISAAGFYIEITVPWV